VTSPAAPAPDACGRRGRIAAGILGGLALAGAAVALLSTSARGGGPTPAGPAEVAILFSGAEHGLLKPCGCSEPQRGGLARRAAFLEAAAPAAKAFAAVSLGDTLDPVRTSPPQNALKADLFRSSLRAMGYAGSVLAPSDLWIAGLLQPFSNPAETPHPPLNVKPRRDGELAVLADADPVLRLRVGDLRVRVVSVVDANVREELVPALAEAFLDPDKALDALAKEPGLLVVAAHALREDMTGIARAVDGKADVVVVVDVPGQVASGRPYEPGKPWIVHFDAHGKDVGVLSLRRTGETWAPAWEEVPLEPDLEKTTSRLRGEVDLLFASYRERVKSEGILAKTASFPDEGGGYAGSASCRSCHEKVYESWAKTKHSHALETLAQRDYASDPECVQCHTVGWQHLRNGVVRTKSGFQTPEATPALGGVGCESCHGPGADHVKDPKNGAFWGKAPNWRDPGKQGCMQCHDLENSVKFADEYESRYRPQVDHRDVPKDQRTNPPK
jgi:hypothetical protein